MSNMSSPVNDLCKNCTQSWIDEFIRPRNIVSRVEFYVILAATFTLILSVLGPRRRQYRHWLVQYGVKGAYLLSFPILSYALGLMQGGIAKNQLYPVWAVFLIILFGGSNSVSVLKLDENKDGRKVSIQSWLPFCYLGLVGGIFMVSVGRHAVFLILIFLLSEKHAERVGAMNLASDPMSSGSWLVTRYMKCYAPVLSTGYNPRSMQGYNYLVFPLNDEERLAARPREADIQKVLSKYVTLDKIWCHCYGVLSTDDPAIWHLKDLCLSFALFRLAVRRYFGYACVESGLDETRDLVLQGLLPSAEDQDCDRAFQVIEVELGFLYEFFFTQYAAIMSISFKRSAAVSLLITIFLMVMGVDLLTHLNITDAQVVTNLRKFRLVQTRPQDVIVAKVILCALPIFQLWQLWLYCSSDWAKLSLVCKYISKPSWQGNTFVDKLVLFMGKCSFFLERYKWFHRWEKKLGQYSLLDSWSLAPNGLAKYCRCIPRSRQGRKLGTPILVPTEVKKAIARALKKSNGQISNGELTLRRHGMTNELYWACQTNDDVSLAQVILIWHIATSYCEAPQVMRSDTLPALPSRLVATSLSKYCAYLVAFAPRLVPGNPLETESILDELVLDAKELFQTGSSDMYESLKELQNQETVEEGIVFAKGAALGVQLENMDHATRWTLLADFWAELMLYIAPSDNVAGHIESLAQGGEFVTHIWALLMHAGILERPSAAASA